MNSSTLALKPYQPGGSAERRDQVDPSSRLLKSSSPLAARRVPDPGRTARAATGKASSGSRDQDSPPSVLRNKAAGLGVHDSGPLRVDGEDPHVSSRRSRIPEARRRERGRGHEQEGKGQRQTKRNHHQVLPGKSCKECPGGRRTHAASFDGRGACGAAHRILLIPTRSAGYRRSHNGPIPAPRLRSCLCKPLTRGSGTARHGSDRSGRRTVPVLRRRGHDSRDAARRCEQGRVTSRELVHAVPDAHRARTRSRCNAVIAVNPRALDEADAPRPRARARARCAGRCTASRSRSRTTSTRPTCRRRAARWRSTGFVPPYEATLTTQPARGRRDHHRQDGDDRAGQLGRRQPDADAGQLQRARRLRDEPVRPAPRSRARRPFDGRPVLATGGSSSGIGTAASFWAANVGTETSGSILSPANQNMLVGIKPTVGRISRYGVIPITADQDTAGPDGAHGDRRGHPAGRARGRRARSATTRRPSACTPPPGRDYTTVPDGRRAEGRAHRHPARVLLRRGRQSRARAAVAAA